MADLSGTITTGNQAQTIASFDPRRRSLSVDNTEGTENLGVVFGGTATLARPSFIILPGQSREWGPEWKDLIVRSISIIGPTTGQSFTAYDSST